MKRIITTFLFCTCVLLAYPRYIGDLNNDNKLNVTDVMLLVNIVLGNHTDYEFIVADINEDETINVTDVMCLVRIVLDDEEPKEIDEVDALYITYSDEEVTYKMPSSWKDDVTVSITGGHVEVVNTNTTDEYVTVLSGSCTDGSLTYTGSYKTTLRLNGVTLTNPSGGCIDIEDGKRLSLELADGTVNTLTDGAGSQKAAFYCKGHLEVSGGGTLNVTGNLKHAIRSKEIDNMLYENGYPVTCGYAEEFLEDSDDDGIYGGAKQVDIATGEDFPCIHVGEGVDLIHVFCPRTDEEQYGLENSEAVDYQ